MESDSKEKNTQTHYDAKITEKVRFNGNKIIEVNRQNLLESSPYFQNILSSCFKDHKTEYVEVNYPGSFETFDFVMQFINYGDLELKEENIFDIFQLADYLQMDKIKTCCLDKFTSSLDRNNVQSKFNMLKTFNFPVEEFKQRAQSFIKNISCGIYFMQTDMQARPQRSHLNLFSEENNTFSEIIYLNHTEKDQLDLHRFDNTLVMCPSTRAQNSTEPNMIMYDLITGRTKTTKLSFEGPAVSCSNEKRLFVISVSIGYSGMKVFYVEMFHINNYREFHSSKNTVYSSSYDVNNSLIFHFAHFFDDKIYVFYQSSYNNACPSLNNEMIVVCSKTMRLLQHLNLADDALFLGDEIVHYRRLTRHSDLSKMFHYKKEDKLFMRLDDADINSADVSDFLYLVFDFKNQHFYFKGDIIQFKEVNWAESQCNIKIAVKGDEFYVFFLMYESDYDSDDDEAIIVWREMRTFNFEKDALVDTGVKWKSGKIKDSIQNNFDSLGLTTSILFVQNVKLH